MNIYIKTMTEDDDKEVVAQACMSISDFIKDNGYMAIESCKYGIMNFISSIRWNLSSAN